jgi:hypothetical protein
LNPANVAPLPAFKLVENKFEVFSIVIGKLK